METMKKRKAFTLAEVLITLAIIGVVAALTIPTVVARYQEKQTVAAVKKFYSDIFQAYNNAIVKNGSPENWGWQKSSEGVERIMNILAPYLRIEKNCGAGGANGSCFPDEAYKTLNPNVNWYMHPSTYSYYSTARLDNGYLIWIWSGSSATCNTSYGTTKPLQNYCGAIGVDINGYKKPNALGKDTFYFNMTKYGVVPKGTKEDTESVLSTKCKLSSTNVYNGYACTAWIIAKGNMDYLRRDVSW